MRKKKNRLRRLRLLLVVGGSLFFTGALLVRSDYLKNYVKEELVAKARKEGVDLRFEKIELISGVKGRIHQIQFQKEDLTIEMDAIDLVISPISLFFGELSLSKVEINKLSIFFTEESKTLLIPKRSPVKTSIAISLKSLTVKELICSNLTTGKSASYLLNGSAKIEKQGLLSGLDLHFKEIDQTENHLDLSLGYGKNDHNLKIAALLQLKNRSALEPFFELDEGSPQLQLSAQFEGPVTTWKMLQGKEPLSKAAPLTGFVKAHVMRLAIAKISKWDRPFSLESTLSIYPDQAIDLKNLSVKGPLLILKAQGALDSHFVPKKGSFSFSFPKLALLPLPFYLEGTLSGKAELDAMNMSGSIRGINLKLDGSPLSDLLTGKLVAKEKDGFWQGQCDFESESPTLPASASLIFIEKEGLIELPSIKAKMDLAQLEGAITIQKKALQLDGTIYANIPTIATLQPLLPFLNKHAVQGSLGGSVQFNSESGQKIDIALSSTRLCYDALVQKGIFAQLNLTKNAGHFDKKLTISSQEGFWKTILLGPCQVALSQTKELTNLDLFVTGFDKEPFDFELATRIKKEIDKPATLQLDGFSSHYMGDFFELHRPATLTYGQHLFSTSIPLRINSKNGFFELSADLSDQSSLLSVNSKNFPLAPFFFPFPDFSVKGTSSINAFFKGSKEKQEGSISALLEEARIDKLGGETKLRGDLSLHLDHSILQLHTVVKATKGQFFDLQAALPVTLQLFPFALQIQEDTALSGKLLMDGYIEELFDFIDLGSHSISGMLSADLKLSNSKEAPYLNGRVDLQKGSYENDYTGTSLRDISALALAEKTFIELKKFSAFDEKSGAISAKGLLDLSAEENFPFKIQSSLSGLQAIDLENVRARLSGNLEIKGDKADAAVLGKVKVTSAELEIPDKLPITVAQLPIEFIYPPHDLQIDKVDITPLYPLNLNLDLSAPGKIFLRGNGLSSEWKGSAQVKGTSISPIATGRCDLVKGEYLLGSKIFQLTEGTITFSDKDKKDGAHISLKGALQLDDALITISYLGPLFSPEVTFSSSPHMPVSSILSRILFNKDISDITPIQAFQLAPIIVSLTGNSGPDILQLLRKNLGIDKFLIVPGQSESDEISVQIGKYLVDGVMVTLSRSASSSQVMVEVELKRGFSFQAETQEEEEGKFTLKWNYNY